jgi:dTDP-glucose pyrophosphorylase
MQAVFVCGGKGTRLGPRRTGPKSLVLLGCSTLLARLVACIGPFHSSAKPPVVIIDAQDEETPGELARLIPGARLIRQAQPDGVANALLLAQPFLDDLAIVALGDVFLDGTFASIPQAPGLTWWRNAPAAETGKNFGIETTVDGVVADVIEKPADCRGLGCGMGVYVLTHAVISCFRRAPIDSRTGERGITAGVQAAIDAGVAFRTIPFSGYYNNVNAITDVIEVERHLDAGGLRWLIAPSA